MNISEQHPDNFLDLEFLNMIKDPIDEMKKIYEFIGEPFGEKTEVAMEAGGKKTNMKWVLISIL